MEAVAIKEKTKELIDTLDDNQAQLVFNYAQALEQNQKLSGPELAAQFRKYWGKIDLDIDLDALRGRNDPR